MVELPETMDSLFFLSDRHCHCDFSIDAVGSIAEYCAAAVQKGLRRLTLTTHYDEIPGSTAGVNFMARRGQRVPTSPELLQPYVDDIRRAQEQFAPQGLLVEAGLEFGWYRGCEERVAMLRERFGVVWILVGLHELDAISFASRRDHPACFARYSADGFLERYFEEIAAAAESGVFDAIAHLDYYRKYGSSYYGDALTEASRRPLQAALDVMASRQVAAEINTSGLRRRAGDWFPDRTLVEQMIERGVRIASLGSDAHRPEDVGDAFDSVSDWFGTISSGREALIPMSRKLTV